MVQLLTSLLIRDDQIEVLSTRLPFDKAELKEFFPKKWHDQHAEVVLEVVRREFKEHVNEIKNMSNSAMKKKEPKISEEKWTTLMILMMMETVIRIFLLIRCRLHLDLRKMTLFK